VARRRGAGPTGLACPAGCLSPRGADQVTPPGFVVPEFGRSGSRWQKKRLTAERIMAYSESLAGRLRGVLARRRDVVEKKMFGGVVFLLDGNMFVGVWK